MYCLKVIVTVNLSMKRIRISRVCLRLSAPNLVMLMWEGGVGQFYEGKVMVTDVQEAQPDQPLDLRQIEQRERGQESSMYGSHTHKLKKEQ